jgi:hypothetical protein
MNTEAANRRHHAWRALPLEPLSGGIVKFAK